MLLPWYVTGQLPADELERVQAHLATCDVCRAQLAAEERLRDGVVALDPVSEAAGWRALQRRINARPQPRRRWDAQRRLVTRVAARPRLLAGLAAAQAAALALVFVVARPPEVQPGEYTVLSSSAASVAGNAMIVFRPDVTEREMRETLIAVEATIVGGPTASDAYILQMPDVARADHLRTLRAAPSVVIAVAIDGEPRP